MLHIQYYSRCPYVQCIFHFFLLIFSLLIKTKLRPELETSVSVDDVISLDESVSIDSVGTLSPTHYIEKATNVAMSYLPSTNEVIDQVANRATVAKDVAQNIAADTVHRTRFV